MTPEEARQALETKNAAGLAENTTGFWCYVIKPADGQWGGKVLHFWPIKAMREKVYPFGPEFTSICNLDTEKGEWRLPTEDIFYRLRLPRCKRCVKRLTELTAFSAHPRPVGNKTGRARRKAEKAERNE